LLRRHRVNHTSIIMNKTARTRPGDKYMYLRINARFCLKRRAVRAEA
jgi:hypothetical protein